MKKIILIIIFIVNGIYSTCSIKQSEWWINVDGGVPSDYTTSNQIMEWFNIHKQSCMDYLNNEGSSGLPYRYFLAIKNDGRKSGAYICVIAKLIESFNGPITNQQKCECSQEWQELTDITWFDNRENITGCVGFDTNAIITDVKCYELGYENPLKPKNTTPTANGKWVYIIYKMIKGNIRYDSAYKTVVTNGCAGVSWDGNPLRALNAKDSIETVDGVRLNKCFYNGNLINGSCLENGIDTSCLGQVPFLYNSNNDSIINKCKFVENIDTNINKRPDDPINNESDSSTTGKEFAEGINKLSSDMRTEHAMDRQLMNQQLNETKNSNNLLNGIQNILKSINDNVKNGIDKIIGKLDTNITDKNPQIYENGAIIDTSNNNIPDIDTAGIMSQLRGKIQNDTIVYDTLINDIDTNTVKNIFSRFNVDWGQTDCDCNSEWFIVNAPPYIENVKIDICQYNIQQYTKWIFKIFVILIIFIFYRNNVFKALMEAF